MVKSVESFVKIGSRLQESPSIFVLSKFTTPLIPTPRPLFDFIFYLMFQNHPPFRPAY